MKTIIELWKFYWKDEGANLDPVQYAALTLASPFMLIWAVFYTILYGFGVLAKKIMS